MNIEKVYPRKFSEKDKKDASAVGRIFIKLLISGLFLLITSYVLDNIMKVKSDVLIGVLNVWLSYIVIMTINSIRRKIKFNKYSKTYIVTNQSKKEIMIFYDNSFLMPLSDDLVTALHAGRIIGGKVGATVQGAAALAINTRTKKFFDMIDFLGIPANLTIENVLNDPKFKYEYYKNVSLLNETDKYFIFRGTNISYTNVENIRDFKIYKRYNNIDELKNFNK